MNDIMDAVIISCCAIYLMIHICLGTWFVLAWFRNGSPYQNDAIY